MEWAEVLTSISQQISRPSFETWIAETSAEITEDTIFVRAKTDFQAEWLENRYKPLIAKTVKEIAGKNMEVVIVINDEQTVTERSPFQKHSKNNVYEELKNLIITQQNKINELEERIYRLEHAEKIIDDLK